MDQAALVSEEERAVALYKKQCMSCHAVDLSGRVGPSLQKAGSQMTVEQLAERIRVGGKGMPAYQKILKAEEVEALAHWLSKNK